MASTGDPDLDRRLHAAIRDVMATFSVNLTDISYRMNRDMAAALRTTKGRDEEEQREIDAFADECAKQADTIVSGGR